MDDEEKTKRKFPHREEIPCDHQPDQDRRTDYGKDQKTTHKG